MPDGEVRLQVNHDLQPAMPAARYLPALGTLASPKYRKGLLETIDALVIIVSGIVSALVCVEFLKVDVGFWPMYALVTLCGISVAGFTFRFAGCYADCSTVRAIPNVTRLMVGLSSFLLLLFAIGYYAKIGTYVDQRWVILWLTFVVGGIVGFRLALGYIDRKGYLGDATRQKVAVIGGGDIGAEVVNFLRSRPDQYLTIVGMFDDRASRQAASLRHQRCGTVTDLASMAHMMPIDSIIIALPLSAGSRISEIIDQFKSLPVEILVTPSLIHPQFLDRPLTRIGGLPAIKMLGRPLDDWCQLVKIVEDKILTLLLLIPAIPILFLAAIAIKIESPGPVLFRQRRKGFRGEQFMVYQMRTMRHPSSSPDADRQATKNDPRVTRVGRFLRRSNIDELPQLFNVLKGDMSLVGPRPHALKTRANNQAL